ncbi:MAG: hypothetical protein ABUT20_04680, partial [Bacteroidota bacterium]
FEIALTEYKGKVYGYSRSEFIVNDTLYYIVKRVMGTIDGNSCEVKDDEIISYNFPTRLDKGVKVTSTFYRNKIDSTWYLAGTWKTNKTKEYYSVTGTADMKGESDLTASKIFPHLEELKLANDVAFYKERKKENENHVVKNVLPEKKNPEKLIKPEKPAAKDTMAVAISSVEDFKVNPNLKKPEDISRINKTIIASEDLKTIPIASSTSLMKINEPKKDDMVNKVSEKKIDSINAEPKQELTKINPVIKTEQPRVIQEPLAPPQKADTKSIAKTNIPVVNTQAKQPVPEIKKPETTTLPTKNNQIVSSKPIAEKPEIKNNVASVTTIIDKKDLAAAATAAAAIKERKSEFNQVVNFNSDSLELVLYDNGEIDGDTVSVLLNGEIIVAKQCLKASAYKKTLYITPGDAEFSLVLYAENLGGIPPNTGLMVVHDGDDVYNVRFTADFQKNAGVIFRRKK